MECIVSINVNLRGSNLSFLSFHTVLAFPAQDSAHPNFHEFTVIYEKFPGLFLTDFFAALKKMGKLGVSAQLSVAGVCPTCPQNSKSIRSRPRRPVNLQKVFEQARKKAAAASAAKQAARQDEITRLTTPLTTETSKAFAAETKLAITKANPRPQPTDKDDDDDEGFFDDDDGEGEGEPDDDDA